MRNLKAMGLAALMALAASAMFAGSAQAQEGTLTAGATPETHQAADITTEQYPDPWIAGEEWNFLQSTPGGQSFVRCDTANLKGTTATGTATTLTITPEYIHCTAGTQAATVNMNGCDYILTRPTRLAAGEYTGKVDLTCPENKKIEVKVYLFGNATQTTDSFQVCTIKVWPTGGHQQELGGHVIYKNIPGPPKDDVTVKVTAEGITSEDGCETGEVHNNGIYKQTLTVKAFKHNLAHTAANQLDLWVSG